MDRFDFPKNFRDFLDTVLKTGVLDATSLVCLGGEFGHDWRGMGDDILETAHCGIHEPKGNAAHKTIVKAWDAMNADNAKAVEHLMVFEDGPIVKAIKEGRPLEMDELFPVRLETPVEIADPQRVGDTTPAPATDDEIVNFCAEIESSYRTYYEKHYTNLSVPKVYPDKGGRKYVRIVREETSGGRSVICFVERATGLIWKAAGWKAPAKNFSRGNIWTDNPFHSGSIYGL